MDFFKNKVSDIRFWILLFFLLRLFAITDPPLEVAHNWRQTTVTMPARHFVEEGPDLLYPKVDFAGEKTGITGMEFPLLNYLIYLVSLVFGYAHWYGRLINLIVSSIGLWYFFKLVKKYFSEPLAFNATFILLFSVWFTYSRKIMPDTFSMSLVIMGIYYGSNYFDVKRSISNLLFYLVFALLGALSKLPSAYLLIVFAPFLLKKGIGTTPKLVFCAASLIIITAISAYYFYWVPYLTERFGFSHFFMGKGILQGAREILQDFGNTLEKFYLDALQIIGFLLFIAGLFIMIIKKQKRLLLVFTLCAAAFALVMFKAGFTFTHHSYYIVPFAPVMALVAAQAVQSVNNTRLQWALLMLIMTESVANKIHDFRIKKDYMAILQLETQLDRLGPRSERIAINSGDVPTPMYFAHRKGWIVTNEKLADTVVVDYLKANGLKHIVTLKKVFGTEIQLGYKKVYDSGDFCIYEP